MDWCSNTDEYNAFRAYAVSTRRAKKLQEKNAESRKRTNDKPQIRTIDETTEPEDDPVSPVSGTQYISFAQGAMGCVFKMHVERSIVKKLEFSSVDTRAEEVVQRRLLKLTGDDWTTTNIAYSVMTEAEIVNVATDQASADITFTLQLTDGSKR